MPESLAVRVQPVTPETRPAVLALRLPPGQVTFAGEMPGLLEAAEADPQSVPMGVLLGEKVVGYFRLDFTPGAVGRRDFGPGSVGLRAFLIGPEHQGQGLGQAALRALRAWLTEHHPDVHLLALSVNHRNPGARRAYGKVGFVVDGGPYLGGSAGPQDVMVWRLRP